MDVRGRATDREAQGRSDDGTAGAGKPELAGVAAAQTAEGQRKPGRERRERPEHRKVSWVSWVSSVEWTKPEGGTGRGGGNPRLPRSVELIVAETGHLESNVVGTKNPRRGGPERRRKPANQTAKAARAVHPGSTLKGSRTSGEGLLGPKPGNGWLGVSATRCWSKFGGVVWSRKTSKSALARGTDREGAPEAMGCYAVGRSTSVEDGNPMRGSRTRDGNVVLSDWRRRSSLWRGKERRE
jgi:hypothetical protein